MKPTLCLLLYWISLVGSINYDKEYMLSTVGYLHLTCRHLLSMAERTALLVEILSEFHALQLVGSSLTYFHAGNNCSYSSFMSAIDSAIALLCKLVPLPFIFIYHKYVIARMP